MRYFLDAEFNGFGGQLILIALAPEDEDASPFYEALDCHEPRALDARACSARVANHVDLTRSDDSEIGGISELRSHTGRHGGLARGHCAFGDADGHRPWISDAVAKIRV